MNVLCECFLDRVKTRKILSRYATGRVCNTNDEKYIDELVIVLESNGFRSLQSIGAVDALHPKVLSCSFRRGHFDFVARWNRTYLEFNSPWLRPVAFREKLGHRL